MAKNNVLETKRWMEGERLEETHLSPADDGAVGKVKGELMEIHEKSEKTITTTPPSWNLKKPVFYLLAKEWVVKYFNTDYLDDEELDMVEESSSDCLDELLQLVDKRKEKKVIENHEHESAEQRIEREELESKWTQKHEFMYYEDRWNGMKRWVNKAVNFEEILQANGIPTPPIFCYKKGSSPIHINDNYQEPSTLPIFNAPSTSIVADYQLISIRDVRFYIYLVEAIENLKKDPIIDGPPATKDGFLREFCANIKYDGFYIDKEQVARLSPHLRILPEKIIEIMDYIYREEEVRRESSNNFQTNSEGISDASLEELEELEEPRIDEEPSTSGYPSNWTIRFGSETSQNSSNEADSEQATDTESEGDSQGSSLMDMDEGDGANVLYCGNAPLQNARRIPRVRAAIPPSDRVLRPRAPKQTVPVVAHPQRRRRNAANQSGNRVLPPRSSTRQSVPVLARPQRQSRRNAANQSKNIVLPPRTSTGKLVPAVARPRRAQGRNAHPRNGGYHSGQRLTPAQVNEFLAQNPWEVRVVPLTQAQIDEAFGRGRRGARAPRQPRSQGSTRQPRQRQRAVARQPNSPTSTRNQRAGQPQVLRRSERIRKLRKLQLLETLVSDRGITTSGGLQKKSRMETERLEEIEIGPTVVETAGEALRSGIGRVLPNARNHFAPSEDEEENEEEDEIEDRNEEERRGEPLSFEESRKIDPISKMEPPPSWASKFGHFFYWPIIVSLGYFNWDHLTDEEKEIVRGESPSADFMKSLRRKVTRRIQREWDNETAEQKYERRQLEEQLSEKHIRMIHEDVYRRVERETSIPLNGLECKLQIAAVPLPPIFKFNSCHNICHISDDIRESANGGNNIEKEFEVPKCHNSKTSKRFDPKSSKATISGRIYNGFLQLYSKRKYLSPEQLEQVRTLQLTDEQIMELMRQIWSKEDEDIKSGLQVENKRYSVDEKQEFYRDAQTFFGASRLDFLFMRMGIRVPPVYVRDDDGNRWHISDCQENSQEGSSTDRMTLKESTPGNYYLSSFKSTYSWIFDAPLELMAADYLFLRPEVMSMYLVLVKVIDYLEVFPGNYEGDPYDFLVKFGKKISSSINEFKLEHAERLSNYIGFSPEIVLDIVKWYGKDQAIGGDTDSEQSDEDIEDRDRNEDEDRITYRPTMRRDLRKGGKHLYNMMRKQRKLEKLEESSSDQESDSDGEMSEVSDGAADEAREQGKDGEPCSSGQLSVRSTQSGSTSNLKNKRQDKPGTSGHHNSKRSRLEEGGLPKENEGRNQKPQPLQASMKPRSGANAVKQRGQIENAPIVNQSQQAVLTPGPIRSRDGQPIPTSQLGTVSARNQETTRHRTIRFQTDSNRFFSSLRLLPPMAPTRKTVPAVTRSQTAQGRNAHPRNDEYRSGQTLTPNQVDHFLAHHTCEVRVTMMSQTEIQQALGQSGAARQSPQPRTQTKRAQAKV
ncbi:unnamed protein product [Caenorhabditis brenneri]